MILYAPFLHHLSEPARQRDIQAYTFASACVTAARQTISVAEALDTNGFLDEAYWFTPFVICFAASTLLFAQLRAQHDPTLNESLVAGMKAKTLLEYLAGHNDAVQCCLEVLKVCLNS